MATINAVGNSLTGSTGSGAFVGATSPSLTTPALGTPSSGVLSSCTGYAQSALTGLGTGVSTALGNNANAVGGFPTLVASTTFTPVFTSSGGGTATYSTQTGNYVRIGNLLYFNIILALTGLPSAGNVTITGLPVTAAQYSVFSLRPNNMNVATTLPTANVNPGSTTILLFTYAGGALSQLTVAGCNSNTELVISGVYQV